MWSDEHILRLIICNFFMNMMVSVLWKYLYLLLFHKCLIITILHVNLVDTILFEHHLTVYLSLQNIFKRGVNISALYASSGSYQTYSDESLRQDIPVGIADGPMRVIRLLWSVDALVQIPTQRILKSGWYASVRRVWYRSIDAYLYSNRSKKSPRVQLLLRVWRGHWLVTRAPEIKIQHWKSW